MPFLRVAKALALLFLIAATGAVLIVAARRAPSDLPWTPLDLGQPVGLATHAKLIALPPDRCRALLDRAGIAFHAVAARPAAAPCDIRGAVAFAPGGSRSAAYAPAAPPLACPLAAGLALWEWDVVQPAAIRLLGSPVVGIDHYGSFACRRLYGRATGGWSEHARARAIDIAGFRLANGRRITVAADWAGTGPEAAFLHAARDGACRLFSTTLSPDYNAAHRDHLHLDQAERWGGVCR